MSEYMPVPPVLVPSVLEETAEKTAESLLRGTLTPEFYLEINQLGLLLAGLPFPVVG